MSDSKNLQQFEELLDALEKEQELTQKQSFEMEDMRRQIQTLLSERSALKEEVLNQQSQLLEQKERIEMQSRSDLELQKAQKLMQEASSKEKNAEIRMNNAIRKEKESMNMRQDSDLRMKAAMELEANLTKEIDKRVKAKVTIYEDKLDTLLENRISRYEREQTLLLMALSGYSVAFTVIFILSHWQVLHTASRFAESVKSLWMMMVAGIEGLFRIITCLPGINNLPVIWNQVCAIAIIAGIFYLLIRYVIYLRVIKPIRNTHKKMWEFYRKQGIKDHQKYVTIMITFDCFNAALLIAAITQGAVNYLWTWLLFSTVISVLYHTYCCKKKPRILMPHIF